MCFWVHHQTMLGTLDLERSNERLSGSLQSLQLFLGQFTSSSDSLDDLRLVGLQRRHEGLLELTDSGKLNVIQETVDTSVNDWDLLLGSQWRVLLLLQQLGQSLTSSQGLLGGGVQVGTELGESSDFSVLSQEQFQRTSNLFHGLNLSSGTDTRDGQTDVDSWSDTLVEQLSLQENLTISDGNDVGWNVSGHITTLGLNDWQSSQRTGTVDLRHLSGSLQQTGVQVENITWVSLSSWWTSQQQRQLTVSNGLLGQVIVDDQGVSAVVSEPLTDGTGSERSQVLQWGGLGSGGGDNDTVLHGVVLLQGLDQLGNGGSLLAHSDVDTVQLLGLVSAVVPSLLVQDGVNGNGGLTGLSVTNDQLSLASTDWHQSVDGLKTGLHWLVDGSSWQDTWGLGLGLGGGGSVQWSLTVDWVTQTVNNTAQQLRTNRNLNNLTGSLDWLRLLDGGVRTEQDNTDLASLQVQGHTLDTRRKLNQLTGLDIVQTEDTGDTVTDRQNSTGFVQVGLLRHTSDSLLQDGGNLSWSSLSRSVTDSSESWTSL